jgi:hypothetical protein
MKSLLMMKYTLSPLTSHLSPLQPELNKASIKIIFRLCLLTAIVLLTYSATYGQRDRWVFDDHIFNTLTQATTSYAYSNSGCSSNCGIDALNSLYTPDENFKFYVRNNEYFDASGSSIGNSFLTGNFTSEIEVVPQPGSCNTYCVLYNDLQVNSLIGSVMYMQEIDVNPNTGVVTVLPAEVWESNGQDYVLNENDAGMAVSRPQADGSRLIYIIGESDLTTLRIDASGINLVSAIDVSAYLDDVFFVSEADLSPNGQWLAVAGAYTSTSEYYLFNVLAGTVQNYRFPSGKANYNVTGVEFGPDSDFLYYTFSGGGLYEQNVGNNSINPVFLNSIENTQLELGKDGNLYGFGSNGFLNEIDRATGTATQLTVTSSPHNMAGYYVMPQQVDGEDDDNLVGNVAPELVDLTINDSPLPVSNNGSLPLFYDCMPIDIDVSSLLPTSTVEVIVEIDNNNGTFSQIGAEEFLLTDFPLDLRCVDVSIISPGPNCDLFGLSLGSDFRVRVIATGAQSNKRCPATDEITGFFTVSGDPGAIEPKLSIFSGVAGDTGCDSDDYATPCIVGETALNFDLSNSTGVVNMYRLFVREVNCLNGNVTGLLYDSGLVPTTDITTLQNVSLNSFIINGSDNYFVSNGSIINGNCYILETYLANPCGSVTAEVYFQIDNTLPFSGGTQLGDSPLSTGKSTIRVFPNPAVNELNLQTEAILLDRIFTLYDNFGREMQSFELEKNTTTITVNLTALVAGNYYLRDGQTAKVYRFTKI